MTRRALTVTLVALVMLPAAAQGDSRDGPIFEDTAANGRLDIGPVYVFRSPSNANNTVLIMTAGPFAGNLTPSSFVRGAKYDIKIDAGPDARENLTLRTTFGPPNTNNVQTVLLRCLPARRCPHRGRLARGKTGTSAPTGQNLPISGGGQFRAGIHDNPEFFDQGRWSTFVAAGMGAFPRPVGQAHNFYGPKGNILAITIEMPSSRLGANGDIVGVWARTALNGVQQDREGKPFVNTGLIPPVFRNDGADRRNAFNAGLPRGDVAGFHGDMLGVLEGAPWNRTSANAETVANLFLPDELFFQIGAPNGFGTLVGPAPQVLGNGRRLSDDVFDSAPNFASGGGISADNVSDDNGLKVTDGSVDPVSGMTRAIAFPYMGLANLPLNGPGTGPNP
jgi:hypothetical protein